MQKSLTIHCIAFNAVFGKVGRVASENVVVELLKTKCLPVLLYGLEACPLTKTQFKSLNYDISISFRKIFNVSSNQIVYWCRYMFIIVSMLRIAYSECEQKINFAEVLLAIDNTVCALCRQQADIELASLN